MMEIFEFPLPAKEAGHYDSCSLCESEVKDVMATGADAAWYYYGTGCYEGYGQMLLRKGDRYSLHDMGHCSCYGPTDDLDRLVFVGTIEDEWESMSGDLQDELAVLFAAAGHASALAKLDGRTK